MEEESIRKIFIGGLNYITSEESLQQYFGKFGNLTDCVVMKFPDTKRSRGFGFVTYAEDSEVDACQSARPHIIDGKQVETKRATPREHFAKTESGQSVKKIFIGGLRDVFEDEELKNYFTQYGTVVKVEQMTEKETGKKRGFGFVEFDDYDPVDKATLKSIHDINGHKVDVKKAISKQEMNARGRRGGFRGSRSSEYAPRNFRDDGRRNGKAFGGGGGGSYSRERSDWSDVNGFPWSGRSEKRSWEETSRPWADDGGDWHSSGGGGGPWEEGPPYSALPSRDFIGGFGGNGYGASQGGGPHRRGNSYRPSPYDGNSRGRGQKY